jgi:hypothetical protein
MRCLVGTNLIKSPNCALHRVARRVTRYRDGQMAQQRTAVGFLKAEASFRRLYGQHYPRVAAALERSAAQVRLSAKGAYEPTSVQTLN